MENQFYDDNYPYWNGDIEPSSKSSRLKIISTLSIVCLLLAIGLMIYLALNYNNLNF